MRRTATGKQTALISVLEAWATGMPLLSYELSCEPQYQRPLIYICWTPWTAHARMTHVRTGAPPVTVSVLVTTVGLEVVGECPYLRRQS